MPNKTEYHIPVTEDDLIAIDVLAANTSNLSKQSIKSAMQKGCVWLEKDNYTQRLRRAKKKLQKGDILHVYYDSDVINAVPLNAKLIADEGDYSIWNKPSGMFSQGSKWGDHCTIYRYSEKKLSPERAAFVVHRLDRAASGLIILAHKKKIAAAFSSMFQQHAIEKHYVVLVEGNFSVELSKKPRSEKIDGLTTIAESLDGKTAISHIQFVDYDENNKQSLLDVEIETGRKHQIRKHLSGIGYPVVGDRLYGSKGMEAHDCNLQLTAVSLQFICPVTHQQKKYLIEDNLIEST